jgi:hypothetical protein
VRRRKHAHSRHASLVLEGFFAELFDLAFDIVHVSFVEHAHAEEIDQLLEHLGNDLDVAEERSLTASENLDVTTV